MSAPQNRQPTGVPVGGQFAISIRGESGITLDDATPFEEQYLYPDITEATGGDEVKQAGEWVRLRNATLLVDGTMIRLDFMPKNPDSGLSGGSMTFPVAHRPAVRRRVLTTAEATDETTSANSGPKRLRNLAQVREDQTFLDVMEQVEDETRVRDLEKGDWVREHGGDEYGVVKSVGLHTLRTDTWSDDDTDEGDHVVAVVRKEKAAALLAEHGVIPDRTVNAYAKRREAALDVADRWDATGPAEQGARRGIGYNELRKAVRDVWLSTIQAGLSSQPVHGYGIPNRDTLPEIGRMERAYYNYHSMLSVGGHSDALADRLVGSMRVAIAAADEYFGERPPASPRTRRT